MGHKIRRVPNSGGGPNSCSRAATSVRGNGRMCFGCLLHVKVWLGEWVCLMNARCNLYCFVFIQSAPSIASYCSFFSRQLFQITFASFEIRPTIHCWVFGLYYLLFFLMALFQYARHLNAKGGSSKHPAGANPQNICKVWGSTCATTVTSTWSCGALAAKILCSNSKINFCTCFLPRTAS